MPDHSVLVSVPDQISGVRDVPPTAGEIDQLVWCDGGEGESAGVDRLCIEDDSAAEVKGAEIKRGADTDDLLLKSTGVISVFLRVAPVRDAEDLDSIS